MTIPTTQQDVLLPILAMDAYSRGSNLLLTGAGESELSRMIGTAVFERDSDTRNGAVGAGFSAFEYHLSDGKKVIAYRGTDLICPTPAVSRVFVNGTFTTSVVH